MKELDWIAVDWGTSHLRVWGLREQEVIAQAVSDQGMVKLDLDRFEWALLSLIEDWLPAHKVTPVLACGMVGSRQGWIEAPYRSVPCTPLSESLVKAPAKDPRIAVFVIPGLQQTQPADVIRGEETQIAGFLKMEPNWTGVLCLPGTHSKWACIESGQVTRFQTFMTGELFALLSTQSVLRHALSGWHENSFREGLQSGFFQSEQILSQLFTLRAETLLNGLPAEAARARLSGLLIGAELAAAQTFWRHQRVSIIGAEGLSKLYLQALLEFQVNAQRFDVTEMTLHGLMQAFESVQEFLPCAN